MRIGRLDLIRYGRFTDVSLSFPRGPSDLHVIYGPNEAGKSTSLAAIEDCLFGIGPRSPYNFLHEHASLRIGGVLEHSGGSLEVVRRKGIKETLLTPEGTPLPAGDRALTPFLNGVTRELFTRMMSLDHERLTAGGREILEARDEVGQMLFAAGTGLSGLREHLSGLEKTADELWAPRHAARRKYYEALDALVIAEKRQREQTVTAADWGKLKRALDEAQTVYDKLLQDVETRSAEQRKLSRIRRVYRRITQLADIERELDALGESPALPEDAERRLTAALADRANAEIQIGVFVGQLEQERAERGKLQCDETVLAGAEAIEAMHQRRIEVQKERSDLPKRQAELAAKERALEDLAGGLGWGSMAPEAIEERLPTRARVTTARALLNGRGECLGARNGAREALTEAEGHVKELKSERQAMAKALDVSRLAAALSAARNIGDVASRIEASDWEVKACETKITSRLGTLRPPVASEERLTAMSVPARAAVETHRDEFHRVDQRARDGQDLRKAAERDHAQTRQAYERRAHAQEGIAPEALRHAREDRETGWRLIRRRYIEGREISEAELTAFVGRSPDLPGAYEGRVQAADTLADRRFENAQAAGEMAVLERQIEDQEGELAKLTDAERDLAQQRAGLESAWRTLWVGAELEPLAPEVMLDWLSIRAEILTLMETREAARAAMSQLREKEAEAKAGIVAELSALGEPVEGLEDRVLSVVIEQAAAARQRQETLAKDWRGLEERIRKAESDVARKAAALQEAEGRWSDWQRRWGAVLTELGLMGEWPTETVTEQIDTLERMRVLVGERGLLRRERIEKIELDIRTFATAAADLVQGMAPDLAGRDADQAVVEL
ncbi:MAG: AAA family ATPase, partial [Acidimicrobiales bacterium]